MQNTRRTATIVSASECEFLVVDKDDFMQNGLHLQMQEEYKARYEFFRLEFKKNMLTFQYL